MARRVIGISTYRERARWGVWDAPADVLHVEYARAVERAIGTATTIES